MIRSHKTKYAFVYNIKYCIVGYTFSTKILLLCISETCSNVVENIIQSKFGLFLQELEHRVLNKYIDKTPSLNCNKTYNEITTQMSFFHKKEFLKLFYPIFYTLSNNIIFFFKSPLI